MSGGLITTRAAVRIAPRRGSRRRSCSARSRPLAVAAGVLRRAGADSRACRSSSFLLVGGAARRARPTPIARRRQRADGRGGDAPRRADDAAETSRAVDPLSVEVGYALVALVDEKQGGTLLDARARRSAGRSPPRPASSCRRCTSPTTCSSGRATYAHPGQGRRGRARRAVCRIGCWPSTRARRRDRSRASQTREPAFGLPASWIADRAARRARSAAGYTVVDPTTALSTHLSETIRTFLPDLLSRQQTKELVDRVGADVAEAGRGAGAEGRVDRRDPARAAAAAARARAGARPDDDPRGDGRRGRRHRRIRTSIDRGRARGARPRHLPAVPERQGRAAGHQRRAGARGATAARRSSGPSRARCWRSTRSRRRTSPSRIARALETGRGTACASCARRRCVRTSGGCSRGCCRTSACCRTTRCRRRCGSSPVATLD